MYVPFGYKTNDRLLKKGLNEEEKELYVRSAPAMACSLDIDMQIDRKPTAM